MMIWFPARATVEAMQALGPALPKVDPKTLFDNSLLKNLAAKVLRHNRLLPVATAS
jgi:hypothetical protein